MVDHFGDRCHDCGNTYPQCVYEFHHLDPNEKDVNPSKALSWSEDRMWKELNKCIMQAPFPISYIQDMMLNLEGF